MEFREGLTDSQSWHLLENMKLAHLSKETKTVEIAMGCGALGSTKNGIFLGIIPPPLGTFRNKNITFGQKKVEFSRPKTMATKISQKV